MTPDEQAVADVCKAAKLDVRGVLAVAGARVVAVSVQIAPLKADPQYVIERKLYPAITRLNVGRWWIMHSQTPHGACQELRFMRFPK